ncbi:Stromelysin-1, partial [Quillaja saponaria]
QETNSELRKTPNLSGSRVPALTSRALIEIIGRVLSRDHSDFKDQVVAVGPNPSDGPPLKEGPNPYAIEFGNPTHDNFSSDFLRVGSQVVIRRESNLARITQVNREVTGRLVHIVIKNGGCR